MLQTYTKQYTCARLQERKRGRGREKSNNQANNGRKTATASRLAAGAAAGHAAHGGAADGLIDPVEAGPPGRGPRRRRGGLLGPPRWRWRWRGGGEERLDGVGRGRGGGATLAREGREAVHEAGEVDGGGLGLEHRVREQEVDGARLERVVGAEGPPPGLQQVRRRAQHVARRGRGGGGGALAGGGVAVAAGDVRDGDDAGAEEVLDVAVGVDDADPRARAQRRRRRRREAAAHRASCCCAGPEGDATAVDSGARKLGELGAGRRRRRRWGVYLRAFAGGLRLEVGARARARAPWGPAPRVADAWGRGG
jgi:hypothetical protein